MQTDLEIANSVEPRSIQEIAEKIGVPGDALHPYGHHIAKVNLPWLESRNKNNKGKLVLVTAISPTPAGEGKTTTSIGLADGLRRLGKNAVLALREPSLGPCFGVKGGAAGGGWSQVIPMEDINLHFTGDIHAITASTNLLAAMIDNHLYWGNELGIDPRKIFWNRAVDLNDRSLRHIVQGLHAPSGGGIPRESAYDITVASETMAVFCLASNLSNLQERLGKMIVAETSKKEPVTAADLKAHGSMSVLLKNALMPNLVQTLEGTPAFIHGGPFANIAHGCNSVIATKAALSTSEIVVTEAGFGADLGAEKFFDIKCRAAGIKPDAAVIVATVRAIKMHGGADRNNLDKTDLKAVEKGLPNLLRHIENIGHFGMPAVVALNRFPADSEEEINIIKEACENAGSKMVTATHWANGGAGAEDLASEILSVLENKPSEFNHLYESEMPLFEKIKTIATKLYHAGEITADAKTLKQMEIWQERGYGNLPVCMAKTPASFSSDPSVLGAPENHNLHIRDAKLNAGAGFIVAMCGNIMTMPGLPRIPAANNIGLDENGETFGLF